MAAEDPRLTEDARKQIEQEHARLPTYRAAADFWRSYEKNLLAAEGPIFRHAKEMENETQWRGPQAPAVFSDSLQAGGNSIKTWLDGATALREKFDRLVLRLPTDLHAEFPLRARGELVTLFGEIKTELDNLPKAQKWAGPNAMNAPGGPPGPGGPGAAPAGPGGPGMKESTPDTGATPPGGGQPGGDQPGADMPSTDQTGTDLPGADEIDQLGSDPGTDPFTSDPIDSADFDPTADDPFLPRPDPSLAGTPSATLTPPGSSISPLSSLPGTSLPSTLTTGGPSSNPGVSPFPLTPMGSLPAQTGTPARRDGSDVDGQPVRPPGGGGESNSRTGAGFYPPIYPPMGAGGVGGTGGAASGDGPYARNNTRQANAREARRAGLRPQLLGRAGARADEANEILPAQPFSGGEVLDEELWQVPGAAPATPPEPEVRRRQL